MKLRLPPPESGWWQHPFLHYRRSTKSNLLPDDYARGLRDVIARGTAMRDDSLYERVRTTLGDITARTWDANSYVWRYRAGRAYDVSRPYGGDMARALSRVQARALIISSSSDRTVFPDLTAELARGLASVEHHVVETDRGHAASGQPVNSPEWRAFNDRTKAFLERLSAE